MLTPVIKKELWPAFDDPPDESVERHIRRLIAAHYPIESCGGLAYRIIS